MGKFREFVEAMWLGQNVESMLQAYLTNPSQHLRLILADTLEEIGHPAARHLRHLESLENLYHRWYGHYRPNALMQFNPRVRGADIKDFENNQTPTNLLSIKKFFEDLILQPKVSFGGILEKIPVTPAEPRNPFTGRPDSHEKTSLTGYEGPINPTTGFPIPWTARRQTNPKETR